MGLSPVKGRVDSFLNAWYTVCYTTDSEISPRRDKMGACPLYMQLWCEIRFHIKAQAHWCCILFHSISNGNMTSDSHYMANPNCTVPFQIFSHTVPATTADV